MITCSSRLVVEGVFWKSGVVRSFKMVDPVLFVCISRLEMQRSPVLITSLLISPGPPRIGVLWVGW
jgi:hypothetical protein